MIVGLFGYIVWDRRTMMKPMQEKLESMEKKQGEMIQKILHDEIKKSGIPFYDPRVSSIINAMRDMAKKDKDIAIILQRHNILDSMG